MIQRCIQCGATYPLERVLYTCAACGDLLEIAVDAEDVRRLPTGAASGEVAGGPRPARGPATTLAAGSAGAAGGVWRYAAALPVEAAQAISLGEGATRLHRCERLGRELGVDALYVKTEGDNPTGSFKDRGMTVGVTQARRIGAQSVACASTGNTSASMAAYAAKAGLEAVVLVPDGKIAMGKLAQAVAHAARIVQIAGNFDDAMRLVQELSSGDGRTYLLNSINPFRLEGQKTLAYEVCDTLGDAPDTIVLPLGNAGNISAIWKGICEFHLAGRISRRPRMIGVQAAGAAPLAAFLRGQCREPRMADPETIASAIRIGAPVSWKKAAAAITDSRGSAESVTDEEILRAQRDLARLEGLFVEPSSATPIAWLRRERPTGLGTVVCVATGHGLKDPDAVLREAPNITKAGATLTELRSALG
ncbi:Threonine synthase [Phycisphaerae bacterium RAS1]|nr:Threonine synthase [Phycisphaerae bacterium RAS1]